MAEDDRRPGERRRAARHASEEGAEDLVASQVALRIGQAVWYAATYPVRLLARAFDALS